MKRTVMLCLFASLFLGLALPVIAAEPAKDPAPPPAVYPAAIFAFQERGTDVKEFGGKIADLLNALLSANPDMLIVDRAEMAKMLTEQEINAAGLAKPEEATKIGQLTGAKLLITGSVFTAGKKLYLTTKIIGTETTRVVAEQVSGAATDDLGALTEALAVKISQRIAKDSNLLMPKPVTDKDLIAELKAKLGEGQRPTVTVNITERHVGAPTIDPAANTELVLFCKETGFKVLDNSIGVKPPPLKITGEGMSEFATRIGDLVSVRARLEVKVIDPATDEVITVDRQTVILVGVTELIAGKEALQKAASTIALRLLPKLVAKPAPIVPK